MKKIILKPLLFSLFLVVTFCLMNTNVHAKTVLSEEIPNSAYVIGSYVFTRDTNTDKGYNGRLTTNLIMLASKSIESDAIDDMIIYYKTATGKWINGLNGTTVEAPASFDINYTNLKLEDVNNTVSAPKAPILYLNSPDFKDQKTDMMSYQLDIYIDDVDDKANKVDGVELEIVNYLSQGTHKDLKYGENFTTVTEILSNTRTDLNLVVGRQYHSDNIQFDNKTMGSYSISARAYVLDGNGKKTYSDYVRIAIDSASTFPTVQITNKNANPDYISIVQGNYIYKLGIEKPNSAAYVGSKAAYKVSEITENSSREIGIFRLDEEFTVPVPGNSVKTYRAQIGYYDDNNRFIASAFTNENAPTFVIDTRKPTAPTFASRGVGYSSIDSIKNGEYIHIDSDFYETQAEDTLDYNIEKTEIYRIDWVATPKGEREPQFTLITDSHQFGFAHFFPPNGAAYYVARVYATNAVGKRVYSDFSDYTMIVRTPIISSSELKDGKVTVSIENQDEFDVNTSFIFYTFDSTNGEVELGKLQGGTYQEASIDIAVDKNMNIYARAYEYDWLHSQDERKEAHSENSNSIDVVIE